MWYGNGRIYINIYASTKLTERKHFKQNTNVIKQTWSKTFLLKACLLLEINKWDVKGNFMTLFNYVRNYKLDNFDVNWKNNVWPDQTNDMLSELIFIYFATINWPLTITFSGMLIVLSRIYTSRLFMAHNYGDFQ